MKISRTWMIWALLGICALTVFGAMAWLTRNVIAAGQERSAAEERADLEERTRLALWRMDALGSAIVLRENQHSITHYDSSMPSPFLTQNDIEVLLHFQVVQGGGLTSPENDAHHAQEAGVDSKLIVERIQRMERLRALLAANSLPGDEWAQLSCAAIVGESVWSAGQEAAIVKPQQKLDQQSDNKISEYVQESRQSSSFQMRNNINEFKQRAKAVAKNYSSQRIESDASGDRSQVVPAAVEKSNSLRKAIESKMITMGNSVEVKPMRSTWLGGELFLLRQVLPTDSLQTSRERGVDAQRSRSIQGVWIDAEELKRQLLQEVSDLLPHAVLKPAVGKSALNNPLALVAFPFLLDRNELLVASPIDSSRFWTMPLRVGWAAVTVAIIASSLLVHGIMRLSERRASFVSAVTHELRTPLTTFRLYSDMLESGAVKEEKRGYYLNVLTREADRLSHLVENVLAFSQIERGNARSFVCETSLNDLLERWRERFELRLAAAGLSLKMDDIPALRIRIDTAALEHVLFNLIDNAAKYAAGGEPALVEIQARCSGSYMELRMRDYGPGISRGEQKRVFRAFHKSAREAAETKPGVGLGLALSRRLAKSMGGSLECVDVERGACFVLSLPMA